jgi:hypothetical protein
LHQNLHQIYSMRLRFGFGCASASIISSYLTSISHLLTSTYKRENRTVDPKVVGSSPIGLVDVSLGLSSSYAWQPFALNPGKPPFASLLRQSLFRPRRIMFITLLAEAILHLHSPSVCKCSSDAQPPTQESCLLRPRTADLLDSFLGRGECYTTA